MPSATAEPACTDAKRAELSAVLQSQLFLRSPSLAHLLSYLCEKAITGESDQVKEYSIAVDVFARPQSFDQDNDSIVRVQANRLRKRLAEYYSTEGSAHRIQITIPVGQYVPIFEEHFISAGSEMPTGAGAENPARQANDEQGTRHPHTANPWILPVAFAGVVILAALALQHWRSRPEPPRPASYPPAPQVIAETATGLPVGQELRILPGVDRSYVDRAGKLWSTDNYFSGGIPVRSPVRHIWRTLDPAIYRSSRQGDFTYEIPLKPGVYELHLMFAETVYGPEEAGGGGEGSRIMNIAANGKPVLSNFDVIADSGGARTADVRVFTDIAPGNDGFLHLSFSSAAGGRAMISGIEILPGVRGRMRPVRIVARDVPYYSNDSHWWSPDIYFKGGQLGSSEAAAVGTDDPELYETERWGHFSYAIPVTPGRYTLILHFVERIFPELAGSFRAHSTHDGSHLVGNHPFAECAPTPTPRIIRGALSPEFKQSFLFQILADVRGQLI